MKGAEPVTSGMANALIGRYLTQLNLSADAIMFATSASPESMLWVDTGHPGKEGISYTILPADNPSTEPASPPAIETVAIDRQASPSIDGTHYGKWTVHAGSDLIAIFSASTEGKGLLAYICPPSKNCRFALSLELGCDAGDQYVISYQVDSYSKKDVIATCDTDKKFLYLDNGASFMKDISNEVGVTFYTRKINGDDVSVRFNLVGFDDANAVLTKAGYLGASSN